VTIFLVCGFAAKYREGGGNFSVPLQRMLGLRRFEVRRDLVGVVTGDWRFARGSS